jgi:hypothetical protein
MSTYASGYNGLPVVGAEDAGEGTLIDVWHDGRWHSMPAKEVICEECGSKYRERGYFGIEDDDPEDGWWWDEAEKGIAMLVCVCGEQYHQTAMREEEG